MDKTLIQKGKFLSLVLRHAPEKAQIVLDKNGWANVADIIKNCSLTKDQLVTIVDTNNKKRFEFDDNQIRIRARQGHSIEVDVELKEFVPNKSLYHGTAERFRDAIILDGIKKQTRQHVHMSDNKETARNVGSRHGEPAIFIVDAVKMYRDGFKFFKSNNDVYLTDYVPPVYLTLKK